MSRYGSAALATRVFAASAQGFPSGVAFALYNPKGSGVNCIVWKFSMAYVSGGINNGFAALFGYTDTGAAAATGPPATVTTDLLGNTTGFGQKAKPLVTTGTLPSQTVNVSGTAVLLRPLWTVTGDGRGNTRPSMPPFLEDIDLSGEFVIAPGATVALKCTFTFLHVNISDPANTTMRYGVTWSELPIRESNFVPSRADDQRSGRNE